MALVTEARGGTYSLCEESENWASGDEYEDEDEAVFAYAQESGDELWLEARKAVTGACGLDWEGYLLEYNEGRDPFARIRQTTEGG